MAGFLRELYRAFVDGGRWTLYLKGVLTTVRVTALALSWALFWGFWWLSSGRPTTSSGRDGTTPFLGILNLICKIYTTIIRGTPMIVQMLIMGSIIFASSRNFTIIGTIALGINSGAYVSEALELMPRAMVPMMVKFRLLTKMMLPIISIWTIIGVPRMMVVKSYRSGSGSPKRGCAVPAAAGRGPTG